MRFTALVLPLFSTATLFGQNVLYNEERNKVAQSALEAARQVASTSLSATEMRNLGLIEQEQVLSAIEWYRVTMRTNIQSFRTWSEVKDAIDQIQAELESRETLLGIAPRQGATVATLQKQTETVSGLIATLKTKAAAAQAAAVQAGNKAAGGKPSEELKALGQRVGQFDDLLAIARKLSDSVAPGKTPAADKPEQLNDFSTQVQSVQKAIEDIQKGIQEVTELAQTVEGIIQSWKDLQVDPASLAPSPENIALELLQREAEFIKALTAIRVQRYLEVAEMRKSLRRFAAEFGRCHFSADQLALQVTDDLQQFVGTAGGRADAEQRLLTLLLAAQISARQTGGQTMNDLRESIEFRRYQVRRNAVYNGGYEIALQAATERLAAYYASGLKPSQIAQLIYQLSTAVALPYVAVTK